MRTCAYHARVALAFSVSSEKLICSYNAISRAVYALETGCSIPGSCCKQLIILFAEPHGPGMDAVITLHQEGNETNRGILTMPMSGIELFNTTNYSFRPDLRYRGEPCASAAGGRQMPRVNNAACKTAKQPDDQVALVGMHAPAAVPALTQSTDRFCRPAAVQ